MQRYLKGQSHSRSRTNHSQITHILGLWVLVRREIDQIFGASVVEITDFSRINHAWISHVSFTITDESLKYRARRRIQGNMVQYSMNIWRTPDAWINDGARPNTHASRISTYKRFRSAMNVIRAWFRRDLKVGRQWTDVDVRGFEPVPTHKH